MSKRHIGHVIMTTVAIMLLLALPVYSFVRSAVDQSMQVVRQEKSR